MHKNILFISIICLIIGFISAYFILSSGAAKPGDGTTVVHQRDASDNAPAFTNPFQVKDGFPALDTRLDLIENDMAVMKQQIQQMQLTLQKLTEPESSSAVESRPALMNRGQFSSALNQRLYNIDNLIKGGIDPVLAEDIVRRKNSIELKRLELQDRATRDNFLNTQQYYDELAEIDSQDLDLRAELGEDRYDRYLYNSKQNNRIRITSVMLESAAEQAGILAGDIILSYDGKRMFLWQELKDATAEGQLGEYVPVVIYRDGEIFSFSVPRGPLGIQMGATRMEP
jgi:membrane-associated protease RseP (regulator of RpoE activity)